MRKGLGLILILAALTITGSLLATIYDLDYWLAPPKEKFLRTWANDVEILEKSNQLPVGWQNIREISLKTDNSIAQDWIVGMEAPIKKNPQGKYRLDVFIIHQLEDTRYGAVVQYNLVDLVTGDTTWELGRTFKLGYVY